MANILEAKWNLLTENICQGLLLPPPSVLFFLFFLSLFFYLLLPRVEDFINEVLSSSFAVWLFRPGLKEEGAGIRGNAQPSIYRMAAFSPCSCQPPAPRRAWTDVELSFGGIPSVHTGVGLRPHRPGLESTIHHLLAAWLSSFGASISSGVKGGSMILTSCPC